MLIRLSKSTKYLKAASVVESVIAITIMSICILIAFMVYVNVVKYNNPIHYLEAKHVVERIHQEAVASLNFEEFTFKDKHYTIEKQTFLTTEERVARFTYKITVGNKTYLINKITPYDSE